MQELIMPFYLIIGALTGANSFAESNESEFVVALWKAIAAFLFWPIYHAAVFLCILIEKITNKIKS